MLITVNGIILILLNTNIACGCNGAEAGEKSC